MKQSILKIYFNLIIMMDQSQTAVYRIIDANCNRLREGVRTIEEYYRFVRSDAAATRELKDLRHNIRQALETLDQPSLLSARESNVDVGKPSSQSESERIDAGAVVSAAWKRCQEAARVLEEYLKIVDAAAAEKFKQIRFSIYQLEKKLKDAG